MNLLQVSRYLLQLLQNWASFQILEQGFLFWHHSSLLNGFRQRSSLLNYLMLDFGEDWKSPGHFGSYLKLQIKATRLVAEPDSKWIAQLNCVMGYSLLFLDAVGHMRDPWQREMLAFDHTLFHLFSKNLHSFIYAGACEHVQGWQFLPL